MSSVARSTVVGVPVRRADPNLPRRALMRLPHAMPALAAEHDREAGLLAILVTDLEGFTALVERLGDRAAHALMRLHNRLVRDALLVHGGREVAHTGDGLMAAFRSVAGAFEAAIEVQCALHEHCREQPDVPLRARIGIHVGEPMPEEGRLFGTCVNTAVRVCATAAAQHVLVSDVARQLAAGRHFRFALGEQVALKGLASPMQVHELLWRIDE